MAMKYTLTQEQLDELTIELQRSRRKSRRLTWRERLTGRVQRAHQRSQGEHTYAGRFKPWDITRFLPAYDPDDLDYETLEWLSEFYLVRPALMFLVTTILAAIKNATLECKDADVVAFHKELTIPKLSDLAEKSLKALVYGVSFNEVIREAEDVAVEREEEESEETVTAYQGYALPIREVRHNYIGTVTDVWKDEKGHLAGYTQERTTDVPVGLQVPGSTSWCFVYSVNDAENPVWGKPEIRFAYELAYWANIFVSLAMRRGEKEAGGSLVGYAPIGRSEVEGESVDNLEYLAEILGKLQDHLVTVFPFEIDPVTKTQMWGFSEAGVAERANIAMAMLEYLGKWVFLVLLVPPDVLEVATKPFGSRSAVQTLFDAFLTRVQGLADRWASQVEEQILRPLTKEHFGEQAPKVTIKLVLSDFQREVLSEIFTALLSGHPDVFRLNLGKMAEELGVPVKSEEEIQATPQPPGPPAAKEQEPPSPALTLDLSEGLRWDEIVAQAELLVRAGVPAETSVRLQ